MSLSDDFIAWLRSNAPRVLLAEVDVKPHASGYDITRYMATRGYSTGAADTPVNTIYHGRIVGGVEFTRRLDIVGGGGSMAYGEIELDNEDGELDDWLNDVWANRAINLYLGSPDWARADFVLVMAGVVADIRPSARNRLALQLRDALAPLNTALSTASVGGSADNKDALLPVCLGECFNVTPVLVDAATQKYAVHITDIERVIEVRDNGVPVLYTANLGNGTFTLTAARYGQITADVQGAHDIGSPSVWLNDAGGLVQRIATSLGDGNFITSGDIDTAAMTAFRTACPQPLGLYISERANKLQVMQEIAASVGATVTTTYDGKLILVRVGFDAPVGEITTANMRKDTFGPIARPDIVGAIRIAGERNFTPNPSVLAGSVTRVQASVPILVDEFVVLDATDPTVLADYSQSDTPDARPSLLVVGSDISAEAARLLALWSVPRVIFGFDGYAELLQFEIGDTVTLTHERFGLGAGEDAQIVAVIIDWVTGAVRHELLV